jgi:hypothetical protein
MAVGTDGLDDEVDSCGCSQGVGGNFESDIGDIGDLFDSGAKMSFGATDLENSHSPSQKGGDGVQSIIEFSLQRYLINCISALVRDIVREG